MSPTQTKQTHDTWQRAKGCRIFRSGDKMRVHVPGRKTTVVATFKAHVVTPTAEYLEIIDDKLQTRCVYPTAVKGGAR